MKKIENINEILQDVIKDTVLDDKPIRSKGEFIFKIKEKNFEKAIKRGIMEGIENLIKEEIQFLQTLAQELEAGDCLDENNMVQIRISQLKQGEKS